MTATRPWLYLLIAALGLTLGAGQATPPAAQSAQPPASVKDTIVLRQIAAGLDKPVYVTATPASPKRLYVVEKTGAIRVIEEGVVRNASFLDLSAVVSDANEQGLLGLAFHPKFAETKRLYVNYTDRDGDSRVVEFQVTTPTANHVEHSSARLILHVKQPYSNHNGGHLAFGPDGFLYIGLGDGGWAGDPHNNGQDPTTLLGSMLRIDVDHSDPDLPYAIPKTNPFVGVAGRRAPELWAWGLRNPWRYSFDRTSGDLYIADVGQNRFEEVNFQPAGSKGGENYGWNRFEATSRYRRRGKSLAAAVKPIAHYAHREGVSITGGYVYRGADLPGLLGHYFYADFASGMIRSFRVKDAAIVEHWDWTKTLDPKRKLGMWSSFGEDADGELYLVSLKGAIYRFARAETN